MPKWSISHNRRSIKLHLTIVSILENHHSLWKGKLIEYIPKLNFPIFAKKINYKLQFALIQKHTWKLWYQYQCRYQSQFNVTNFTFVLIFKISLKIKKKDGITFIPLSLHLWRWILFFVFLWEDWKEKE